MHQSDEAMSWSRRFKTCWLPRSPVIVRTGGSHQGAGPTVSLEASNQLSNNHPRQRHTPMDVSGSHAAAHKQDTKARTVDSIP